MDKYIIFIIIIACIVFAILATIFTIIFIKKKNKNKSKLVIDELFINSIFSLLGNKENIKQITVDNARLKFEVFDLNKVDLAGLKELSQNGVFVTNNVVKTLFKFDSIQIKKQMERVL